MSDRKTILFVDDEEKVLESFERMFFEMDEEWDLEYATSGRKALELMKRKSFDLIVSDMRMPEMDGAVLLSEVKKLYPSTIRFILSGYSDREMILNTVGPADQFLTKPCQPQKIIETINAALNSKKLITPRKQQIISEQLEALPTLPDLYVELEEMLKNPDSNFSDIAELVSRDIVISAKIFQLVNSAFFGLQSEITDLKRAISYIGLETLQAIILSSQVFNSFSPEEVERFSIHRIYDHSFRVSFIARKMAAGEGLKSKTENICSMAGILHDIGKLLIIKKSPDLYARLQEKSIKERRLLFDLESEYLEVNHADVAAYLLSNWGMPSIIIEMILNHHNSTAALNRKFDEVSILFAANLLTKDTVARSKIALLQSAGKNIQSKQRILSGIDQWGEIARLAGGLSYA